MGGGTSVFQFDTSDFLGHMGIVLIGISGAICGALGGAIRPKKGIRRRITRDFKEHPVGNWLGFGLLLVVVTFDLAGHVAGREMWYPMHHRFYFMGAAFFTGLVVRFLYDHCVNSP
jgi:hypothetical protein